MPYLTCTLSVLDKKVVDEADWVKFDLQSNIDENLHPFVALLYSHLVVFDHDN